MSIVTLKSVDCDGCGRGSAWLKLTAASARAEARIDGWKHRGDEDYCPFCEVPE